ncbi:MAG: hypothetical protein ABR911_07715 [Syntrophales bacterium]
MNKEIQLEDVLDAYVEATGETPDRIILREWIRRYPKFRRELIEFTVQWSLMETLPPSEGTKAVNEDTLVLRAMSIVSDRLHALDLRDRAEELEISDLLEEIKKAGLKINNLAKQCDLSTAIITKLAKRLIEPTSIPERLIDCLCSLLQKKPENIREYFQGAAGWPLSVRYCAIAPPEPQEERENFFDAIRRERTMDEKQRQLWLSYDTRGTNR